MIERSVSCHRRRDGSGGLGFGMYFVVISVGVLLQQQSTAAFFVVPTSLSSVTTSKLSSSSSNRRHTSLSMWHDNNSNNNYNNDGNNEEEDEFGNDEDGYSMQDYEQARSNFEALFAEQEPRIFPQEQKLTSFKPAKIPRVPSRFHNSSCILDYDYNDDGSTPSSLPPPVPQKFWNSFFLQRVIEDEEAQEYEENNKKLVNDDDDHNDIYKLGIDYTMYRPIPITESSKERRLHEIKLLKSLETSDDGIDVLMSLWLSERDSDSIQQLHYMDELGSPGLRREERLLRKMIKEHNDHNNQHDQFHNSFENKSFGCWVEPISRLASILYYQGRTIEAKHWCLIGLSYKPFHFEIIQTLILCAIRERNMTMALYWTRHYSCPPLNPRNNNKSRKLWVQRAIYYARLSYEQAVQARESMIAPYQEQEQPEDGGTMWQ